MLRQPAQFRTLTSGRGRLCRYALTPTLNIGAAPSIIAHWQQNSGNKFTIPVGLGVNTTVKLGKVPVRIGFEGFYSVVQPDDYPGMDWGLRFFVIPAVPAAVIPWLQKPLFGD